MTDFTTAAIAAKTATVDPTVVLDSFSLAPAVSACKAATVAPARVVINPTVVAMFLLNRAIALTLQERKAVVGADRFELEDNNGHWLFEDGAGILLGTGEAGSILHLTARSLALTVGMKDEG